MKREKAENLIRLIKLLSTRKLKARELAKLLGVQTKQLKRYFISLEDLNLHVDEDLDGRCFLFGADSLQKSNLSDEEKVWLHTLVKIHAPAHPYTAAIAHKLQEIPEPLPLPEQLSDIRLAQNFELINQSLAENIQIVLIDYDSPSCNKVNANRLVEPLEFLDEHRQLKAYEIASRKIKTFKLDRIGQIKLTTVSCTKSISAKHLSDPFGLSGTKLEMVKLKLSPLAKNLMYEEYSLARIYLYEQEKVFFYHGPICQPKGLGRFILGLPGHVKILEGESLKNYLKKEILKSSF
jgi:predicted DNA-binding transcriptional regulator YafY